MNLLEVIIMTALIYLIVKIIRYMVEKSFREGYAYYHSELEEEAKEVIRKIKEEG